MSDRLKLELRRSEIRQRLGEIAGIETLTDELRTEAATLQTEMGDLEIRYRAAVQSEEEAQRQAGAELPDAEMRERIDLRGRARLTEYLRCRAAGSLPTGAEAELQSAAGVTQIPLELWDVPDPGEERERVVAAVPGTTGVNLDTIRPAVFANSIAPMLGIEMPRVMTGTYASATISTSQSASALAKSGAAVGVSGAFSVTTATPKRISARLELTLEDIAAVGQANYESILRQNLALALSDALDDQAINGNGTAPNLKGIFASLSDPADAPGTATDFDDFAAAHAGGVDGLWAATIKDTSIVVGPATYVLAASTFQSAANYKGELSAAAYATANTGGFWTNKRMPAAATFESVDNVQQAILYRKGRMMMGGSGAMRTAVCPHWNEVGVDDIYSGSAKGERYFTMHVLLGDVIVVQPDAYEQLAFRLS